MGYAPKNLQDYDTEPVYYCSRCYSLKIKHEDIVDVDCCMDCGCSDISVGTIEEWENLYERRYGKKYVQKSKDPRNSFVFKLSLSELKDRVYESMSWREIIKSLYPGFPKGLGRADSVILLFDKLIHDNRLNDLKILLVKRPEY